MRAHRHRVVHVATLDELDRRLAAADGGLSGWRLQDLDLRGRGDLLAGLDVNGALFLGCRFDPGVQDRMTAAGALVFPALPDLPFDPYRGQLYTPAELYAGLRDPDGNGYRATPDARIHAWSRRVRGDLVRPLAESLHDLAVDDALDDAVGGRRLVGVMGGHDLARGEPGYAQAATLGRALARRGLTVTTGGGPGAMEAANLGAYLAEQPDGALAEALEVLARVPSYRPSVDAWARTAFEVLDRWPHGAASLGVPTWFYGHEPPNVFATGVAKYFRNALREAILVNLCRSGIVFLPGVAGTLQEMFQDACENFYADGTDVAPMVLVGTTYWTEELPAWPLLERLAADRPMAGAVHLAANEDAAADLLG